MKLFVIITAILCGQQVIRVQSGNFCTGPSIKLLDNSFHLWNCNPTDKGSLSVKTSESSHHVCADGVFQITRGETGPFNIKIEARVTGTVMGFIGVNKPMKMCHDDPTKDSCPQVMDCETLAKYLGDKVSNSNRKCHLRVGDLNFKVDTYFNQDFSGYSGVAGMFSNGRVHFKVTIEDTSIGKTSSCISESLPIKVSAGKK